MARIPLLLIASRNIFGLHEKTCAGAANAKRVQAASPNPFLFHPVYRADALKWPHGPDAAGAGVGAEAAGDALAVVGDILELIPSAIMFPMIKLMRTDSPIQRLRHPFVQTLSGTISGGSYFCMNAWRNAQCQLAGA